MDLLYSVLERMVQMETILDNIYRLILLGEAQRLGLINTDSYTDLVEILLSAYEIEHGEDDKT